MRTNHAHMSDAPIQAPTPNAQMDSWGKMLFSGFLRRRTPEQVTQFNTGFVNDTQTRNATGELAKRRAKNKVAKRSRKTNRNR